MPANVIEFTIRGVDKASGPLGGVSKTVGAITKTAAKSAVAITASATALVAFVAAINRSIDATAKFARRIDVAVEGLSAMSFVASQAGIEVSQFNMAAQRLTRRVQEAAEGMGEAQGVLRELGIDAREFINVPLVQQFELLADKSLTVRQAFKLFDAEGTAVLQMLRGGSEAMRAAARDAEFLGGVISSQAAANAEKFSDVMGRAQLAVTGVSRGIANELTPVLSGIINRFADFVATARPAIVSFVKATLEGAFTLGAVLGQVYDRIRQFADEIFTVEGFIAFVDGARAALVAVADLFVTAAPLLGKTLLRSFQIVWESFTELGKWAWRSLTDFFGGEDTAGTLAQVLFDRIPEATAKAREELGLLFSDVGILVQETGDMVSEGLAATFGINMDLARQQAVDMLENLQLFGEIAEQTQQDTLARGEEMTAALTEQRQVFIEGLRENVTTFAESLRTTLEGTIDGISQGVAATIMQGESLVVQLRSVAQQALSMVIAALVKMGIQRLILAKLTSATTVSESAQQAAKAVGLAGANMFASWAAAPWPISIGAPAAAAAAVAGAASTFAGGAATGAAAGASIAGIAHSGLENVPQEGTFLLNRGERVLAPDQNRDLTTFLNRTSAGGSVVIERLQIDVLPNATNADALLNMPPEDMREVVAEQIIPALDRLAQHGVRPQE